MPRSSSSSSSLAVAAVSAAVLIAGGCAVEAFVSPPSSSASNAAASLNLNLLATTTKNANSRRPFGRSAAAVFVSSAPSKIAASKYEPSSSMTSSATSLSMSSSSPSTEEQPKRDYPALFQSALSASIFVLLDVTFRKLLKSLSVSFPSALAGCGALFATLLSLRLINEEAGDAVYGTLKPGAAVLARWLPVFFVPSLVTLPLGRGLGSAAECLKVAAVVVGGFFFTLLTTAWSVMGVRKLQGTETSPSESKEVAAAPGPAAPAKKAFSDGTFNLLSVLAGSFGIAAALASRNPSAPATLLTPFKSACMLFTTLATYVFGARLPKKFTKVIHPLVICTSLTWVGAKILGLATGGASFLSVLSQYKVGSMCPVHLGAGDLLLFMLGPAVVSLACQMYDRKKLMAQNVAEVGTAVAVSSLGGLFGTSLLVRLLAIADPILRLCMLSRNITSPLAMAIASMIGADVGLAVSTVVVTGLIGANFGASILDAFGITDPVARGLGVGAAAHGLGTAAFANEGDAFPFAAIGMALTASACTVLVSVPGVRAALLKVALGGAV